MCSKVELDIVLPDTELKCTGRRESTNHIEEGDKSWKMAGCSVTVSVTEGWADVTD